MSVKLKFINTTQGSVNPDVLIFQKNVATNLDELAIAWKVIKNCGRGNYHPFTYSSNLELSITDCDGNYSPRQIASSGDQFVVIPGLAGRKLRRTPILGMDNPTPRDIAVRNQLPAGAIDVCVFHDGMLLARKTSVAPGQKALFRFTPTLWIGAVSDVAQGNYIDSAIISEVNTELPLVGIASATIVMTGGGSGDNARPYEFSLIDVRKA